MNKLCQDLHLEPQPQDWGIVNADAERVLEFIDYAVSHNLNPQQLFLIGELILASWNEALRDGLDTPDSAARVETYLRAQQVELSFHLSYWSDLHDEQEFPLALWLRNRHLAPDE